MIENYTVIENDTDDYYAHAYSDVRHQDPDNYVGNGEHSGSRVFGVEYNDLNEVFILFSDKYENGSEEDKVQLKIYSYQDGKFTLKQTIKNDSTANWMDDDSAGDYFDLRLTVSNKFVIISDDDYKGGTGTGKVTGIYSRDENGSYVHIDNNKAPTRPNNSDNFFQPLTIAGDYLWTHSGWNGRLYLWKWSGTQWKRQYLSSSNNGGSPTTLSYMVYGALEYNDISNNNKLTHIVGYINGTGTTASIHYAKLVDSETYDSSQQSYIENETGEGRIVTGSNDVPTIARMKINRAFFKDEFLYVNVSAERSTSQTDYTETDLEFGGCIQVYGITGEKEKPLGTTPLRRLKIHPDYTLNFGGYCSNNTIYAFGKPATSRSYNGYNSAPMRSNGYFLFIWKKQNDGKFPEQVSEMISMSTISSSYYESALKILKDGYALYHLSSETAFNHYNNVKDSIDSYTIQYSKYMFHDDGNIIHSPVVAMPYPSTGNPDNKMKQTHLYVFAYKNENWPKPHRHLSDLSYVDFHIPIEDISSQTVYKTPSQTLKPGNLSERGSLITKDYFMKVNSIDTSTNAKKVPYIFILKRPDNFLQDPSYNVCSMIKPDTYDISASYLNDTDIEGKIMYATMKNDYIAAVAEFDINKTSGSGTVIRREILLFKKTENVDEWTFKKRIKDPSENTVSNNNSNWPYGEHNSAYYYNFNLLNDDGNILVANNHARSPNDYKWIWVYYKDEGGPDNWGLKKIIDINDTLGDGIKSDTMDMVLIQNDIIIASSKKNVSSSTSSWEPPSRDKNILIYKKNEGGNDNWGLIQDISNADVGNSRPKVLCATDKLMLVARARYFLVELWYRDDDDKFKLYTGQFRHVFYMRYESNSNWNTSLYRNNMIQGDYIIIWSGRNVLPDTDPAKNNISSVLSILKFNFKTKKLQFESSMLNNRFDNLSLTKLQNEINPSLTSSSTRASFTTKPSAGVNESLFDFDTEKGILTTQGGNRYNIYIPYLTVEGSIPEDSNILTITSIDYLSNDSHPQIKSGYFITGPGIENGTYARIYHSQNSAPGDTVNGYNTGDYKLSPNSESDNGENPWSGTYTLYMYYNTGGFQHYFKFNSHLEELANNAANDLQNTFSVSSTIVDAMKNTSSTEVGGRNTVSISTDIKDSIIKTSGGEEDTVENISKKRTNFLNILFFNNQEESTYDITSAGLGLDKTLTDTFSNKTVKDNVVVVKKNEGEAIQISSNISSDTAVYSELDTIDDELILDVGGLTDVKIVKTQDASSNGDVDQWTVSYNNDSTIKESGDIITANGTTIYIGSSYIDGTNEGITSGIYQLDSFKITLDDNDQAETDDSKINAKRHEKLNEIWNSNVGATTFLTESVDLGLDSTVDSTTVRTNVKVFKPSLTSMDLSSATSDLSNNLGGYADLSNNGDFIKIEGTTDDSSDDFRIQVVQVNPKRYQIKSADGKSAIYDFLYSDGDKVTYKNKTFHFGGLYTSNENEGIDAGEHVVNNLDSLKIPFKDDNTTVETDKAKINQKRHEKLNDDIWGSNPEATDFTTTSAHLGLDKTIDNSGVAGLGSITPLQNVRVFKAGRGSFRSVEVEMRYDISATQGVFFDLSSNNDYIHVSKMYRNTNSTSYRFAIVVCEENPIGYKLVTNSVSYNNLLNEGYDYAAGQTITYYNSGHIYRAGDKVSFGNQDINWRTFYFTEGGVYSHGTMEGLRHAAFNDLSIYKFGYKDDGTLENNIDNVNTKRRNIINELKQEAPNATYFDCSSTDLSFNFKTSNDATRTAFEISNHNIPAMDGTNYNDKNYYVLLSSTNTSIYTRIYTGNFPNLPNISGTKQWFIKREQYNGNIGAPERWGIYYNTTSSSGEKTPSSLSNSLVNGSSFSLNGVAIHLLGDGQLVFDKDGLGVAKTEGLTDLSSTKIPYTGDNFIVATDSAIVEKRKNTLKSVIGSAMTITGNGGMSLLNKMFCKSNELGLDKTMKTLTPRDTVAVYSNNTNTNLNADMSGTQGIYIDISNNDDIGKVDTLQIKVISENPKKYQYNSAGLGTLEYLPGDVVNFLHYTNNYNVSVEFDEGGMYIDPSNVGIQTYRTILEDGSALANNMLFDMSLAKIPYTGNNFIVAEKSAIRTKRITELDEVYRLNPEISFYGFICKTNELGFDKTISGLSSIKENVKVRQITNHSDIDLSMNTSAHSPNYDITSTQALYIKIKNINKDAKIKQHVPGVNNSNFYNNNMAFKIRLIEQSPNKYNVLAISGSDHPTDKDFVDGEFFTYRGMSFYFDGESIFTNGTNEGVGDGINDLDNLKIPFKDDETTLETDHEKISKKRIRKLVELFETNIGRFSFITKSSDIGINTTVSGITPKTNVKVFRRFEHGDDKDKYDLIDMDSSDTIKTDQGIYADLSDNNDHIHFTCSRLNSNLWSDNDVEVRFAFRLSSINPPKYRIAKYDAVNNNNTISHQNFTLEYVNGESVTIREKTYYFGGSQGGVGIYSSGTNDGIDSTALTDLDNLKIPFENDGVTAETDNDKINLKRRNEIQKLFRMNPDVKSIRAKSDELGLDTTLSGIVSVKTNIAVKRCAKDNNYNNVHRNNSIDIQNDISGTQGAYCDLSDNGDFITFSNVGGDNFRIELTQENPKQYKLKNPTSTSNLYSHTYEDGDKVSLRGVSIYFGSVYTNGTNEGMDKNVITDLSSLKIPYTGDNFIVATNSAIDTKRNEELNKIWKANPETYSLRTNTDELGLDKTYDGVVSVKTNVKVFRSSNSSDTYDSIDISDNASDISGTQGAYSDLTNVNDFITITGVSGNDFKVVLTATNPKTYRVRETNNTNISNREFKDGDKTTLRDVTVYFGGVYTNGTNDGIKAGSNETTSLASLNIGFVEGTNTKASKSVVRKNRHKQLAKLWDDNPESTSLIATTSDLALDTTITEVSVKDKVKVFKASKSGGSALSINLADKEDVLKSDQGVYVDLSDNGDFINLTGIGEFDMKVVVTAENPKSYQFQKVSDNSNFLDKTFKDGELATVAGMTFYFGGLYTNGDNDGVPEGGIMDLSRLFIPYATTSTTGAGSQITTIDTPVNIRISRHAGLKSIWDSNPTASALLTTTKFLGIRESTGIGNIKKNVKVFKANQNINLSAAGNINKNQGVYGDISANGEYTIFSGTSGVDFRIQVVAEHPNKRYQIKTSDGTGNLSSVLYHDGHSVTYDGITFYLGGVYTNGTNDGITSADPYVFPINGNPYKLPDKSANYCLYADKNTFITGVVDSLSKEKQEEMRQWVIEKIGSDTNNGAKLVTDGYFYSNFHINTRIGELYLDMESRVCNTTNKDGFTVKFKNSRDNTELFKGEHKTTATISWKDDECLMAVDVDFFENPQIRNGIRMNTILSDSKSIGLLINDYEPSLLEVSESKNKVSMYNNLLSNVENGTRVIDDKLNLQKEGELWSRHKI